MPAKINEDIADFMFVIPRDILISHTILTQRITSRRESFINYFTNYKNVL